MRFATNILENNRYVKAGLDPCGQLGGMKKLLAKGGNGKFWAKDFGITGAEMVGLSYLPFDIIKPTGKIVEVDLTLAYFDYKTQSDKPFTKKVEVQEWELLDYDRLAKAYEMLIALIML